MKDLAGKTIKIRNVSRFTPDNMIKDFKEHLSEFAKVKKVLTTTRGITGETEINLVVECIDTKHIYTISENDIEEVVYIEPKIMEKNNHEVFEGAKAERVSDNQDSGEEDPIKKALEMLSSAKEEIKRRISVLEELLKKSEKVESLVNSEEMANALELLFEMQNEAITKLGKDL